MAHIRWKGFEDLDTLFEQLGRTQAGKDLAVDMYEDNGTIIVEMHTAGINPDKIDINVEEDLLKISGTREDKRETEDTNYYTKEIKRGSFERVIRLPFLVEGSQAKATIKDGVLKVALPKRTEGPAHKVVVQKN